MKIGLALGGGGVKGMAHVGVLKVIEAAEIPIEVVAGTSSGAIVGALYAAGKTPDEIEQLARRLGIRKWFARDKSGLGLFSTNGIREIIDTCVGQDARIEDLPRRFACVAVDIDEEREVVFDGGPLADAVCASSAYPGIYAPVRVGNRYLFDGGVLNPVPFDIARKYGADRVIACDLGAQQPFFADGTSDEVQHGGVLWKLFYALFHQQMFRLMERSVGIMSQQLRDLKLAQSPPDLIIYPRVTQIGLLDFDLMETCFSAGEQAARELLPEMKRIAEVEIQITRHPAWTTWWQWLRAIRSRWGVGRESEG